MLEYLMGYVDKLEELLFKEPRTNGTVDNEMYLIVMGLKKFTLEDMLVYFMDNDVLGLKGHMPENLMVQKERRKWLKFCTKYKNYVDVDLIMNYFDKQVQKNYKGKNEQT